MLYGRIKHADHALWVMAEDGVLHVLEDEPGDGSPRLEPGTPPLDPTAVTWLCPVAPSKIIAVGRNYALHAQEHGAEVPKEPLLFLKAPSSLLPPGRDVLLPPESTQVEFEGELAVIVGKRLRRWRGHDAMEVVRGWTTADDVTARDLQRADGQWARAKSFDGFCPVAQLVSTQPPPKGAVLETSVNGVVRQSAPLSDMTFSVAAILTHASAAMTLMPGDLVLTGTPGGVGALHSGDRVSVTVTGLPELTHGVGPEMRS